MADRFIIAITKGESGFYEAHFDDGTTVELNTDIYSDAVIEADALQATEFDPVEGLEDPIGDLETTDDWD